MHLVQGLVFAILTEVHKPTFVGYIRFNYKPLYCDKNKSFGY